MLEFSSGYACTAEKSRGRRIPEPPAPTRTDYQRDRDRIVHSTAFRRLVYKTQVFLNHEGDLFRTRLTHSLEVAQLGRSMARSLLLEEDLVEAIALAHDLGHTPFGHAGQDALNECMRDYGGFEHNLQSLRVVDTLEERYPQFDGLNLTFETREGILKHCSVANALHLELMEPQGVGQRFLQRTQPSLEAQLCNLADEIAYNAHDVDDGIRSGLITREQLEVVPLFRRSQTLALEEFPQLQRPDNQRRYVYAIVRRMLSAQVYDLIDTSTAALKTGAPQNVDDVRRSGTFIRFSDSMRQESTELKRFLFQNLYRHPQVMLMTGRAKQVIVDLFNAYLAEPAQMPCAHQCRASGQPSESENTMARVVADYIAGMTDRYAAREHVRLTGQHLLI